MPTQITFEDQGTLLAWAAARICHQQHPFPAQAEAIGVIDSDTGAIKAVFVLVQTYQNRLDMHIASDLSRRWCDVDTLQRIAGYAFYNHGVDRVDCLTSVENKECQIFCIKTGWQIEARILDGIAEGEDGILFFMRKRDCPWLVSAQE